MRVLALVLLLVLGGSAQADVFTFNDIQLWAGAGSNQAAMAIDWVQGDTTQPALVWGYRWDGTASGEDMMRAIVAADPRLFAKLADFGAFGFGLTGFGYDDGDANFALDDGTSFNAAGIAVADPSDGAMAVDSGDRYAEGFFTGFWVYANATVDQNGNPTNPYNGGSWTSSNTGMTDRILANGDWDSWAFSPDFNFDSTAENPVAAPTAVPEPSSMALLAGGAFAFVYRRRRKRLQNSAAA